MNKKQKRVVRWLLVGCGIALLMFVVIFTPILTEVIWLADKTLVDSNAALISLVVLVPLLSGINLFMLSEYYHDTSLQEAKNKLEWMLDNNYIDLEKYIDMLRFLDDLNDKKSKAKLEALVKREEIGIEQEQRIKARIEKAKKSLHPEN